MRPAACLALLMAACGGSSPVDGGPADLGRPDALTDAAPDATRDAPAPDVVCTTDADGDGHASMACGGDDCDDGDAAAYPGNTEVCDDLGHDEDCDPMTLGPDADRDGFAFLGCCNRQASGTVRCGEDCDDHVATIGPTAVEACNGRDDDCNGFVDDGVLTTSCIDADGDGHGAVNSSALGCTVAVGWTTICNDCDDRDPARYPGATETCDGVDHDCNGVTDDHCACTPVGDTRTCGTTGGACIAGVQSCVGAGWDSVCTGAVFPTIETCNGVDDDCDGSTDEGVTFSFYVDCDGDGYGDDASVMQRCATPAGVPPGCPHGFWAMTGGDCDDHDVTLNPTAGCAAACVPPLAECDGMTSTICETDTSSDVAHCGSCTFACTRASGGCSGGVCSGDFVAIDGGAYDVCGVRGDGTVACWGDDAYGQLVATPGPDFLMPAAIAGLSGVVAIDVGYNHECARTTTGELLCFGANSRGELGDGTTTLGGPVTPAGLAGVVDVSCGEEHTCAALSDGSAWCWGWNMSGALGDGTTTDRSSPVQVVGLVGATQVATGTQFSCARTSDGAAWCWGDGSFGTLGIGTTSTSTVPVQVAGLAGVVTVAAGDRHVCARTSGGLLHCWGWNGHGQLGDGTMTDRQVATSVVGLTDVTQVALSNATSCARTGDGHVWCWGANDHGQVGDGTTTDALAPTMVPGITTAVAVVVGTWHGCALLADHEVVCWGSNIDGELGDGTVVAHLAPAPIVDP